MTPIVLAILLLLPSFILGEERNMEEFPACLHTSDCPAGDYYCAAFFCINFDTAKAGSVCAEGEEEVCKSGNCLPVDGSATMATEYIKRRVCLDKQEASCGSEEGARCDPERVCLGGICAPKVYKEHLINKTECKTHTLCQRKDLGQFCCKDFTADNEDGGIRRRCCDSDLELVLPHTEGGRSKLNEALADMEDKLEAVCRSEPLKEHLDSMEACREFTSTTTTTTTTTEATTTTTIVEPIEESDISEEDLGEDLGQDTKVESSQRAVKSLANTFLCQTPPLLLLLILAVLLISL